MFSSRNIYGPSFIEVAEIASGVIAVAIFVSSTVLYSTITKLPTMGFTSVSIMVVLSVSYSVSPTRHLELVLVGSSLITSTISVGLAPNAVLLMQSAQRMQNDLAKAICENFMGGGYQIKVLESAVGNRHHMLERMKLVVEEVMKVGDFYCHESFNYAFLNSIANRL